MSIKLGVIGAGGIGSVHIDAAQTVGIDVVAIADVNRELGEQIGRDKGIPHVFHDARQLYAMPEVQAVVIAAPNKFHAPLTLDALDAGKDVFVEKPMAMTVAECGAMNAAAAKHGAILQVGFVRRFSKVATTARAYIDAGRLGDIYHAKANYYRRRGIPGLGRWFTHKAMSGGGPLIDLGVHVIDLVMHLMHFPKVTRVSGKVYSNFGRHMQKYLYEHMWAGPPHYEGVFDVEDAAHALIRLEGGATIELNAVWAGNFPRGSVNNLIGLFGDKGGTTFELDGDEVRIATEDLGHNVDIIPALRHGGKHDEQMRAFAHSVLTREPPSANGEEGKVVQEIIRAIYDSSEQDREVEL
jgi:predicted dehydrogenase